MPLGEYMEIEIREQSHTLRSNASRYLSELLDLGNRQYEMVLIAARGSSDHAALYARYLIEICLGIPVSLAAPSVLTKYQRHIEYPPCLAIGISQSGSAPDVAEVIADLRSRGHTTLAITNTKGSRLETEANVALTLGVGEERSVAATKTYSASLLAAYQLVRALGGDLPEPELPDEHWVTLTHDLASQQLGPILRCPTLFALARGTSFCSANETALKLMECALLGCKSYSTSDFQHGPKALAGHGSAAIVYGEVPEGLQGQGCLVVRGPQMPGTFADPIKEIVFGQWIALLAARARGLNPDDPQFITKVTQTL